MPVFAHFLGAIFSCFLFYVLVIRHCLLRVLPVSVVLSNMSETPSLLERGMAYSFSEKIGSSEKIDNNPFSYSDPKLVADYNSSASSYSDPILTPASPAQPNEADGPSKHPTAIFFHLFFKVAAALVYLFCTLFSDNFIISFIVCLLLLSFDFWTVKNVSGRLLVGLRWWNDVREDGTTEWMFESKSTDFVVNKTDSKVFWWSTYLSPLLWLLFGIGK